ncbi:nuclear transport factor 2 family protein [uncultured Ruminococcus sp.]|uniref:nuclear transport factor 2 family protein n=1 Tax=uncultured Ruminococcus sp. TaxID=165186 RepID=UPI0025E49A1E|nr:nuclear transport factor 2 family protein [uncultured Ruminococcus sp.]
MLWRKQKTHGMIYPESSEESAVLKAFETMQQAMIDKDMDTLDKVIKAGTIFTHMSGKQQTKAEYFTEIKNGTLNYYGYHIADLHISVDEDHAVLSCTTTLDANVYGFSGSWDLHTNAYFEKTNGEWIYCNNQER